jgi:hypothetical protein
MRALNRNVIDWEPVEVTGTLTPVELKWVHQVRGSYDWPPVDDRKYSGTPDSDIESGRVRRFGSVDDMIAALKSGN